MSVYDLSAVYFTTTFEVRGWVAVVKVYHKYRSIIIIFRRIRCISACCGGEIVIQASDIDGEEIPKKPVLQSRKAGKFWWRRFHISRRKKRCQVSYIEE